MPKVKAFVPENSVLHVPRRWLVPLGLPAHIHQVHMLAFAYSKDHLTQMFADRGDGDPGVLVRQMRWRTDGLPTPDQAIVDAGVADPNTPGVFVYGDSGRASIGRVDADGAILVGRFRYDREHGRYVEPTPPVTAADTMPRLEWRRSEGAGSEGYLADTRLFSTSWQGSPGAYRPHTRLPGLASPLATQGEALRWPDQDDAKAYAERVLVRWLGRHGLTWAAGPETEQTT
jgi:hypothetical protein